MSIQVGQQVMYAGFPRKVEAVRRTKRSALTMSHNKAKYNGVADVTLVKLRTRAGMQSWVRLDRCEVL